MEHHHQLRRFEYYIVWPCIFYKAFQLFHISETATWPILFAIFYAGLLLWLYRAEVCFESDFQRFPIRDASTQGLWCCILLPLCMGLSCKSEEDCPAVYKAIGPSGAFMASSAVIWIWDRCRKDSSKPLFLLLSSLPFIGNALLLFLASSVGLFTSVLISFVLYGVFSSCADVLLAKAPNSFTIGEAIAVGQGIAYFSSASCLNLMHHISHPELLRRVRDDQSAVDLPMIALMGTGLFVLGLIHINRFRESTLSFYFTATSIALGFIIPLLFFCIGGNPFVWFLSFIFSKIFRICLMLFWALLVAVSVFIVKQQDETANTVIRKYFHIVMVVAFVPGVFYDQNLLLMATGITLGIFIILECFRILNIPPLGKAISSGFSLFVDQKDKGPLITTHIYLLIGTSLPLWILPRYKSELPLSLFSGILAVGIGDSAASIGGTYFGRIKLPGLQKTVEGTIASFIAQMTACYCLAMLGVKIPPLYHQVIAFGFTSLLESFTEQIDNFVLPLFLYMFLTTSL